MKHNYGLTLIVIATIFVSQYSQAKRYWPGVLTNWTLSLNNGVAYITSPEFPAHCSYSRGQIEMDGTEFNRSLYAYALSASASDKKINYVVDDTQTVCIITGIVEID